MRTRLYKTVRGTNQYQEKTNRIAGMKPKTYREVTLALAFILSVVLVGTQGTANATTSVVSPLPMTVNVITTDPKARVEIQTPDQRQIADFISQTFGQDAPKAFQLLSCENGRLNPNAVNQAGNFPVGSQDIGVFQINSYWQDVNPKFLYDYKVNVQMAKKIYDDDGGSFKMWSCGRKLGI